MSSTDLSIFSFFNHLLPIFLIINVSQYVLKTSILIYHTNKKMSDAGFLTLIATFLPNVFLGQDQNLGKYSHMRVLLFNENTELMNIQSLPLRKIQG